MSLSTTSSSSPSSSDSISSLPSVEETRALEIAHSWDRLGLAVPKRAADGGGSERLLVGHAQAHRHARVLAHPRAAAGKLAYPRHDLGHVLGDLEPDARGVEDAGLLFDDRELGVEVLRVVSADARPEPVLQRGDDPSPVRVVLRVGRGHEQDVEREAHLVATDLDVALLEHVEQADLDALGQVRELVDGEDPPVRAGNEPVVQGELVGEVAALGHLDGVDFADQVGHRGVRRGELLAVAFAPVHPADRRVFARLGDEVTGDARHRLVRVVVDLRAGDDRQPFVEEVDERADDAALGLAALAEQDHVVAGDERVLERRQDAVLVAEDAVDDRFALRNANEHVAANFFLDRDGAPSGRAQRAERRGQRGRGRRPHGRGRRAPPGGRTALLRVE